MIGKDIAIKLDGVSKLYRIGLKEQTHDSIGSAMLDFIKSPWKNYLKYRSLYDFRDFDLATEKDQTSLNIIWAIKNLSFEVKQGEVLGVIGTNGAGKSTLLKILARITLPTEGRVQIRGRVSSLLEVGTGFHQELTGRENVYLNGTILGMKKKEVERKFDEIVEFSGVEKFLDTPVKRYSSGMRVRLAFAVAAHLEPEILIIDEVLAVGDAAFQKRCFNKMQDVGQSGRTVLFVSHNMPSVTRLCQRAILLNEGRMLLDGTSEEVVSTYLNSGHGISAEKEWLDEAAAPGDDVVRLRAIRIRTEDGKIKEAIDIRQPVGIEMEYEVLRGGHIFLPYYHLDNDAGTKVFTAIDQDLDWRGRPRPMGRYLSTAWIPGNFFSEGVLYVNVGMKTLEPLTRRFGEREVVAFQVIDTLDGDSARGDFAGPLGGVVRPLLRWDTRFQSVSRGTQVTASVV